MTKSLIDSKYADLAATLKIDCMKCSGLCCVALYCTKTDGFPADKEPGVPCRHLTAGFRCDIHRKLTEKGMRGCLAYDCFGAGQKVTQNCYPGIDWQSEPCKAGEIYKVFLIISKLHQIEWYLLEALALSPDEVLTSGMEALITENEQLTGRTPDEILKLDLEEYKTRADQILKQVSGMPAEDSLEGIHDKDCFGRDFKQADLGGRDFSMALLIAANLEGCGLHGTNFLGADMRDANIKNTDLRYSMFLTQMQINSAKGNADTKLPDKLTRPVSWQETGTAL